jgi:hypothetical protein
MLTPKKSKFYLNPSTSGQVHRRFSAFHWQKTASCQHLLAPVRELNTFAVTFD